MTADEWESSAALEELLAAARLTPGGRKLRLFGAARARRVAQTFTIDLDPFEIVAGENGTVYAGGGSNQGTRVAAVDTRAETAGGEVGRAYMQSNLRATPDGKGLHVSSNLLSPARFDGIVPGGKAVRQKTVASANGPFEISPDGQVAVFEYGPVFRLGKTATDPATRVAEVRPHRGIAFDVEWKVVWLATREAELYKLSYPQFERQEVLVLPQPPHASRRRYCLISHFSIRRFSSFNDSGRSRVPVSMSEVRLVSAANSFPFVRHAEVGQVQGGEPLEGGQLLQAGVRQAVAVHQPDDDGGGPLRRASRGRGAEAIQPRQGQRPRTPRGRS